MKNGINRLFGCFSMVASLTACNAFAVQTVEPIITSTDLAAIPNPASVFCEQNGNKLEIFTADDGSQSGVCVFPDGNTCDEWAYFRGECGPSAQNNPTPSLKDKATTEASGGGIWRKRIWWLYGTWDNAKHFQTGGA